METLKKPIISNILFSLSILLVQARIGSTGIILIDYMTSEDAVVLIDGGYFSKVLSDFSVDTENFDLVKFSDALCEGHKRLRAYYYDALPWISDKFPSSKDSDRRSSKQRMLDAVTYLKRFEVRQGKVQRTTVNCKKCGENDYKFNQKLVDVLLSVDLVRLAWSKQARYIVIVSGDSDFVPAVRAAKEAGAVTKVVYAKTEHAAIHDDLRKVCDERQQIDKPFLDSFKR
ncbi:NYN domain-containing protein [Candidatus Micrarchaeota archaeon]|nr:NYN domain-containing protein [Candidatus Micrarchaeota archaeon]